MVQRFLEGVRVLDLSQYVPGPYAALILADLGADVVKIEPPGGEPMRRLGGARDSDGISPLYKVMNGGKTVIELDLKNDGGRKHFEALVRCTDAMVESYRPGVLDRLGFGRKHLQSLNPRLVHTALSGWGQTGPYRLKAGHDLNYMSLGGGLIASGVVEAPTIAWPPVADYASGIQAAASTLAALVSRARTGKGAFIDVSLAETALAWQSGGLTNALRRENAPKRAGNLLNGGAACYNIYRTKDEHFISIGNIEEKFWANFCAAVGRQDWIPRQWESFPQKKLIAEVQRLFASGPLAHWETLFAEVDHCFEPIREFADLPDHPQIAARGLLQRTEAPDARIEVLYPAWIDGSPPTPRKDVRFGAVDEIIAAWTRAA
ncbi:MAG TPA: CoA transferase [Alphaproteobacteria bacterium]|nr:CoA transferase [Alphaproteobacteria bacterium]